MRVKSLHIGNKTIIFKSNGDGGGVRKVAKMCHVKFEWLLRYNVRYGEINFWCSITGVAKVRPSKDFLRPLCQILVASLSYLWKIYVRKRPEFDINYVKKNF